MSGEAKAQCPTPPMVHRHQLEPHFLIQVDGPVGESDAITEAVPPGGLAGLSIQTYVFSFGLEVESWRLSNSEDRPPMATIRQCIIRPVGYRTSLLIGVWQGLVHRVAHHSLGRSRRRAKGFGARRSRSPELHGALKGH